jgi:ABC-2 type transport system permease protein
MLRLSRVLAMAAKELKVVLLDRRARVALIASPVLQLLLFGLATTLEVKNIDLGVVNRDDGVAAVRLLENLDGSRNIRRLRTYRDVAALTQGIEDREVIGGFVIPPDLSQRVAAGGTGQVGLLLDGRRINSAQIVAGYLTQIAALTGVELRPRVAGGLPELRAVNWFNPNLDYLWFTMPGLVALITAVLVLTVSLQAVARERELGTFDQMMVLPLHWAEILIGKIAPAFIVGLANATLYVVLIPLLFGVPLHGSLILLYAGILAFSLAVTGIGLSISSIAHNQQQAFLGGFLVMVPLIMLSGYASPVDNMPGWLQPVSQVDPITHMLAICHGVFLKDMSANLAWAHVWPMLAVATVTLSIAAWLFRLRSE